MFGYAMNETPQLMPLPIHLSHRLVERQAELRKTASCLAAPDAKSQVTHPYIDGRPIRDRHRRALDAARTRDQHKEARAKPSSRRS
jgi:S-adenosylmethionine synthetase